MLGLLVKMEQARAAWSRRWSCFGTRSGLGVMVMVMVVAVMMMSRGSEHRGGKHHQQQSGSKYLLHGKNLARELPVWKSTNCPASRQERGLRKRHRGFAHTRWHRFRRKLKIR